VGNLVESKDELEKSGFIAVYGGYGKQVKERLYRLTDAYSLFYLTFIEPLGKSRQMDFRQKVIYPSGKCGVDMHLKMFV